jgi:hypothetical protein
VLKTDLALKIWAWQFTRMGRPLFRTATVGRLPNGPETPQIDQRAGVHLFAGRPAGRCLPGQTPLHLYGLHYTIHLKKTF